MAVQRVIETTLFSGHIAASFLFIKTSNSPPQDVSDIAAHLGIELYQDFIPTTEESAGLAAAIAVIAGPDEQPFGSFKDWYDLGLSEKAASVEEIFHTPSIVVAHSPPVGIDFISLLKMGSGAVIGAYVGILAGHASPLLLLLTTPLGIIICGPAMGIAQALEQGLKVKVLSFLGLATGVEKATVENAERATRLNVTARRQGHGPEH